MTTPPDAGLAARALPAADYVHVSSVPVPPDRRSALPSDPAALAARVFDVRALPGPIRALFGLRQRLVGLIGVAPAPPGVFRVTEVGDGEALIAVADRHLDFCAGVSAPADRVQVHTRVRLHGWRGRLYFVPVRLVHPVIVRTMIRSAIDRG